MNHPHGLGASFSGGWYPSVRGRFVGRSFSGTSPTSSSSPRARFTPILAGGLSAIVVASVELLPEEAGARDNLLADVWEVTLADDGGGNTRDRREIDPVGVD